MTLRSRAYQRLALAVRVNPGLDDATTDLPANGVGALVVALLALASRRPRNQARGRAGLRAERGVTWGG